MKKVSVVLVGIGGYGSIYVNEVLNPDRNSKLELVGIVDPYPMSCRRLDELRAVCGEPYESIDAFFAVKSADLTVISTPIQFHTENILTALAHGSDVLCEKPLCGDENDINRLLKAEQESGKRVHIGYQWSHSEAIQALKHDIIDGIYGTPVLFKTLVLWPRDKKYFNRGTGWAGKIKAADGSLILDSVANNAAAHYLHNMFYVSGGSIDESRPVLSVSAKLARVNDIENFDTAVIRCKLDGGADAVFIASHTVGVSRNPMFDYLFTGGRVTYTQDPLPEDGSISEGYSQGHIIGVTSDGQRRDYGDPFAAVERKLHNAVDCVLNDGSAYPMCGIKAASVHTRVINNIYKHSEIGNFKPELIKERYGLLYVDGLDRRLTDIYCGNALDFDDMLL